MKALGLLSSLVIALLGSMAAQSNPVPLINQPLVPVSVQPGGGGFILTINGTGFVPGSTVNWNGSPRATTFVNGSQVTATIAGSDIEAQYMNPSFAPLLWHWQTKARDRKSTRLNSSH